MIFKESKTIIDVLITFVGISILLFICFMCVNGLYAVVISFIKWESLSYVSAYTVRAEILVSVILAIIVTAYEYL